MPNLGLLKRYKMEEYNEEQDFDSVMDDPKKPGIGSFKEILDGSLLTKDVVVKQFPFFVFLVILAVTYIGNRYHSEKIVRETIVLQNELKELRYEAIASASELMFISKQSEVAKNVEKRGMGLQESTEPPKKIIVDKIK